MSPHKVTRVFDPVKLNAAINKPEVLQYVAPEYETYALDEYISDRKNVVLRVCDAYSIFTFIEPGIYDGHYLFPYSARGDRAKDYAKKMLAEMFTTHAADAIAGQISRDNRAAMAITVSLGFTRLGESHNALGHECVDYILERTEWEASLV